METLPFRQPRVVALILFVLISAGISALLAIGRQEDPTITNLFATVTAPYPGAEPGRVETLVTAKIEDELREIPEIDTIESVSSTGISIVQIELADTVPDDMIEQVWSQIRDALDDARQEFPPGAQEPEFSSDGAGAFAAIASFSARHPQVPMTVIKRYADDLADELRNVSGTKLVEVYGAPNDEVLITLNPERTAALGLTPDMVSSAVSAADSKTQAGRLRSSTGDFVIEVQGEVKALDRLRDVIVARDMAGQVTRLADIAQVTRGPRWPNEEIAKQNGRPAILVAAKLEDGLQVDVWSADVRATIEAYQPSVPGGLELALVFDQSAYTADRLLEVGQNMLIGVALVVGVLLITLGIRAAIIVALILPVVSLATLATMNIINLPIHQMSVTGLIVALGLLVDAGIVMTDDVGQRIRNGVARVEAVGQSVRRLFGPLFASTVTTALSFTPMILLPGPAGDFVGSIAMAVVIMLIWSFIVAITVTPAIAGWIMPAKANASALQSGIRGGPIAWLFSKSLAWSVANPIRSIALALVLPVAGFLSMPTLTAQFFPGVDRDQFYIELDGMPGMPLTKTAQIVERLDAELAKEDAITNVTWVVGKSAPGFYYNIVGGRDNAPGYAQALITTQSPAATEALLPRLQRTLGTVTPEVQVLVRGLVQGPPVSAPVEIRLVGPDLETLKTYGDQVREILSRLDPVTITRSTANAGAPKVAVDVDEAKARLLGLDLASVSRQLQAGLEGVVGGSMVEGTEELDIRVRLGNDVRGNLAAISDLTIVPPTAASATAQGGFNGVPLSAIADIKLAPSDGSITRRNAERVNTVQAFLLRGVLPEEALKAAQAELEKSGFQLPTGYRLELGGDSDARSNTLNNLLASIGLIVTLTIATIVLTFNSFRLSMIAAVVCLLSAGLSILALAIFQYPFGINAIIGVIGSIGVSINAAIIILTGLQADDEAKHGDHEAMVGVIMRSSRHIVSTTITTFGGFLPLILAGGGFWPPFAMAIGGGVLLSTVVSFYFTPPMFALLYARKRKNQKITEPQDDKGGNENWRSTSLEPVPMAAE
ncbi:MAG: efflux RND transporter permease subunit [Pseudomonadota bacterium]